MSSTTDLFLPVSYFGKLPGQGDFLRGGDNRELVTALDKWVSEGLRLMAEDVGWKSIYDKAQPVDFAFMGSQSHSVVGGRLVPSRDASGRRFPFMAAVAFEVPDPVAFIGRSALVFTPAWSHLRDELAAAHRATEPTELLDRMISEPLGLTLSSDILCNPYEEFLNANTVHSLQELLNTAGHQIDVRRVLLGLGSLMAQVHAHKSPKMSKGLRLPLPVEPACRHLVSTFWLELISGFLDRANFELMLIARTQPLPMMTLGFSGLSVRGVYGVFDPRIEAQDTVLLENPDWAEDQVREQTKLRLFSSYLSQGDLSLKTARNIFLQTFFGG